MVTLSSWDRTGFEGLLYLWRGACDAKRMMMLNACGVMRVRLCFKKRTLGVSDVAVSNHVVASGGLVIIFGCALRGWLVEVCTTRTR